MTASDPTQTLDKPIVVQIGFNKCATKSLTLLFARSGYPSLHYNFRFGKGRKKLGPPPPQKIIHDNVEAGRRPFFGYEDLEGFFDLEWHRPKLRYENYRHFREMHEAYPNARFILNTRSKDRWLLSRKGHNNGLYMRKFRSIYGETEDQVMARWDRDFDEHHAAVRDYFSDKPGRLVEFNIETDGIEKVAAFVAPDFELDLSHWGHAHKSKRSATEE